MNSDLLKQVLLEQQENFLNKETGVRRSAVKSVLEKSLLPHVHVITGMRRTGKSTLIRQIARELYSDKDFYYLNFEDERLLDFKAQDFNILFETLIGLFGKKKVFFLDEVQNIPGFEFFVRRMSDDGFKFYVTGSNANLLSSEISSKLTGRHIDTYLQPFSFVEFLLFHDTNPQLNDLLMTEKRALYQSLFDNYLKSGGMPEYVKYQDDEILFRIYEDIVAKDIAVRYKVTDVFQLKQLYQLLISIFSTTFSYRSLMQATSIQSNSTVKNYLDYLQNSSFGRIIGKFEHSVKKQINSQKKFYVNDHAFIHKISNKLTKDRGRVLENLVFESLQTEKELLYFSGKNECNFICISPSYGTRAIQVCYDLNVDNRQREIAGLLEATNFLSLKEGLILTMNQEEEIEIENKTIQVMPVWKHLIRQSLTEL